MMIGNTSVSVGKLSKVQPLADRLMKRIRVACPFRDKHDCSWEGDYNDLQAHLLSTTAHLDKSGIGLQNDIKNKRHRSELNLEQHETMSSGGTLQSDISEKSMLLEKQERRRSLATSFKIEANAKFSSHNYPESRDLYSKALSILSTDNSTHHSNSTLPKHFIEETDRGVAAILYANRSATNLMLKDYSRCIDDCDCALKLDDRYTKAYIRKSRALIQLGNFANAVSLFQPIFDMDLSPKDLKVVQEEFDTSTKLNELFCQGNSLLESKQYASAKGVYSSILRECSAPNLILKTAQADIGLGLTDSALRLSLQVIRANPGLSEGYEIRGQVMQLMADFDGALKMFRQGLRLNPDSERIKAALKGCRTLQEKMNKAHGHAFRREFVQAIELFSSLLMDDSETLPEKSLLYCKILSKRGESYLRLKKYEEALKDASKAVYSREDHVPAWMIMMKALHGLGRHEDALAQMEDLMQRWGNSDKDIRTAYEHADFQVRKMKRPDFYELFGVSRLASELELKKAYKQRAKEWHPDRLRGSNFTDAERQEAEKKFKLLGEGLEILCDDFKRQLFDEGYDPEAIRDRVAAAKQAAHRQGSSNYHHNHHH
jgi:tetratricopeptide (TPR) repeat protein